MTKKRFYGCLVPFTICVVLACVLWVFILYNASITAHKLELELAKLLSAEPSTASSTPSDENPDKTLEGNTEPVVIEENAADLYEEAFALYSDERVDNLLEHTAIVWEKPLSEWTAEEVSRLRKILDRNSEIVDILLKVNSLEHCEFETVYDDNNIPSQPRSINPLEWRFFANLLMGKSLLACKDGDSDGALRSCSQILRMSNHLANSDSIMGQLVRMAVSGIAFNTANGLLDEGEFSGVTVDEFIEVLDSSYQHDALVRGLKGERSYTIAVFDYRREKYSTPVGNWVVNKNELLYLDLMNRSIEPSRLPYYQAYESLKACNEEAEMLSERRSGLDRVRRVFRFMGLMSFSTQLRVAMSQAEHETRLHLIRTTFELKKYKKDNGSYPEKLVSLAPDYIDKLTIDPFSGNSLLYRREKEGFVLYGVGENMKDDNAESKDDLDIVWHARR
ncbi:hypothetical protein ACFL1X_09030 [Candidatus Hydrogenedentota bacterium]